MPDWTKSMVQTYEYYVVDPNSWKDTTRIRCVKSSSIDRDETASTLGSASISMTEIISECYVRIYLVTIQNGITERHSLGTFLVQTPTSNFDGKVQEITADAYTPLLELKENPPPLGYFVLKGENIMDTAYRIARERVRAPVVKPNCDKELYSDFVANVDDTWITFLTDFITNAKYTFALDELSRILFAPKQDVASMQPIWTYTDDNSSILHPAASLKHDLYGIPNVVEVVYSDADEYYVARAVNDDGNSPTSTVNRGREILHRVTNPSVLGNPTENQLQDYAEMLLRELSSVEFTVTYTHGYCPVRIGDCVRLNYTRSRFGDIKARVIKQQISCTKECTVTETAVFTQRLWR